MNAASRFLTRGLLLLASLSGGLALAQPAPSEQPPVTSGETEVPEALWPWQGWATWGATSADSPAPYNNAQTRLLFWPSRLTLSADQAGGQWNAVVTLFEETWVPLPGSGENWPQEVTAGGEPIPVLERSGKPYASLPAGEHELAGRFRWGPMPQRLAIPPEIGLLELSVDGQPIPTPSWASDGNVWLKRTQAEQADKDFLSAQVYRVIEDGVPLWLRTEIELTVSGKSREEQLGWVLPEGWKLSMVQSPLPVAVDEQGRIKAQVRAGKWKIMLHAFATQDLGEFHYAEGAKPLAATELVAFRAAPDFRVAQLEGVQQVDVNQTTFPQQWRSLPIYVWESGQPFKIVQKMRGMGDRKLSGLTINRQLWLDDDGRAFTFKDNLSGQQQQVWRLDIAPDSQLGAVRSDGAGQLITANPQTGDSGVEVRSRNLNLEAVGRVDRADQMPATGWQSAADSLHLSLTLPPGWRVFALLGADQVQGDWLTAWTLLDLFLLLVFAIAVARLWGFWAGLVALLAFGLAYHEPGAPRLTWLVLLMPLALLRVVGEGTARRWVSAWKYLALALLLLNLIPFVANQVQTALYPQLESTGRPYQSRWSFQSARAAARRSADSGVMDYEVNAPAAEAPYSSSSIAVLGDSDGNRDGLMQLGIALEANSEQSRERFGKEQVSKSFFSNMAQDMSCVIQTGPAEPEWRWNQVDCYWTGPVAADQQVRPLLVSPELHRGLTVARIVLLLLLGAIVLGVRRMTLPLGKRSAAAAALLLAFFVAPRAEAQFPTPEMLNTLRERLTETSDAFPNAADIPLVDLKIAENKLTMEATVHAAVEVAVPLPGRLPSWSPLTVKVDDQPQTVVRRGDGYLWVIVPAGVHRVTVEGLLPNAPEWEWTAMLRPRRVTINAPDWDVSGVRENGAPDAQVMFVRKQQLAGGQAAYDQKDYSAVVAIERRLEIGLVWKVHSRAVRLSSPGKPISLKVPLLPGESVVSAGEVAQEGQIEVRLAAGQESFDWESELATTETITLAADPAGKWVERWFLMISPVWNTQFAGLAPVFEANQATLIPSWRPWPGEEVTLTFSRPKAVSGDSLTVKRVKQDTGLGARQRDTTLSLLVESSLAKDFVIDINPAAEITGLTLAGQPIPVRRDGAKLIVPVRPGQQEIEVRWVTPEALTMVTEAEQLTLPVEAANVTQALRVPESRWVLWADGPRRGPAVRFWTILVCAVLLALVLGGLKLSPVGRLEWVLLAIGLTQIHVAAALLVVGWLFLLAWRGRLEIEPLKAWRFNLLQVGLVLLTLRGARGLGRDRRRGLDGQPPDVHPGQRFLENVLAVVPTPHGHGAPDAVRRDGVLLVLPRPDAAVGPVAGDRRAAVARLGLGGVHPRRGVEEVGEESRRPRVAVRGDSPSRGRPDSPLAHAPSRVSYRKPQLPVTFGPVAQLVRAGDS